jgi:DNA-binding NarL/FixJ family response regulator
VFGVNDFDETLPGPFQWDVKRLVASFAVAGRDRGFGVKQRESVNMAVARSYREAIRSFAELRALELTALILTGGADEAQTLIRDLREPALRHARRPGVRIFDCGFGLAQAWTAAAGGSITAGRAKALAVADAARTRGELAYEALALHDLARLGDAARANDRLRALTEQLDGPLHREYEMHTAALAAKDGHALDRAAERFEEIGAQLLAAEVYAEACAAHRDHGRNASSARSATKANQLADLCEGAATPALPAAGQVAMLTPREREVASLAANGLTNREIAEQLVVSARTVEHHLEHAYQKLGVNDRGELTTLLSARLTSEGP